MASATQSWSGRRSAVKRRSTRPAGHWASVLTIVVFLYLPPRITPQRPIRRIRRSNGQRQNLSGSVAARPCWLRRPIGAPSRLVRSIHEAKHRAPIAQTIWLGGLSGLLFVACRSTCRIIRFSIGIEKRAWSCFFGSLTVGHMGELPSNGKIATTRVCWRSLSHKRSW